MKTPGEAPVSRLTDAWEYVLTCLAYARLKKASASDAKRIARKVMEELWPNDSDVPSKRTIDDMDRRIRDLARDGLPPEPDPSQPELPL